MKVKIGEEPADIVNRFIAQNKVDPDLVVSAALDISGKPIRHDLRDKLISLVVKKIDEIKKDNIWRNLNKKLMAEHGSTKQLMEKLHV